MHRMLKKLIANPLNEDYSINTLRCYYRFQIFVTNGLKFKVGLLWEAIDFSKTDLLTGFQTRLKFINIGGAAMEVAWLCRLFTADQLLPR